MKNLFTPSALYLLLGLFFTTGSPLCVKSQIVSAPAGGLWTSGTTWVGGIVPGAADNVVISSSVLVNGNACNNITISSGGLLRNNAANSYSLTVNGNLTNSGTISNNTSYNFLLNVNGNVTNNGDMSNNTLTLSGTGNQQFASSQPLTIANLTKNSTSGRAVATTNLNFAGTNINLLTDTLEFTTGNTLTISGGYLSTGVFYKSSLPALQITAGSGTYASGLTIDATQTELYGTLAILGNANNFKNNIINFGTLQNYASNSYGLTVAGNFTNNGTVQDNVYNFSLNISGNLANNGIWTSETTTMNGSGNQGISMTQPFDGSNFIRNAGTGRVRATTGLTFNGTVISLSSDTLEFTTGSSLTLNGVYLNTGVIYKSALPALQITSGIGTYILSITIDATQTNLDGTLMIYGNNNTFKNSIFNTGTLQNYQSNAYNLIVAGSFTNNGIVKNNVYNFSMNISGNLANNGTWTSQLTTLNGIGNQDISMTQPYGGSNLTRNASTGRVRATTSLSFVGTIIDFNNDTLQFTTGNTISMSGGYLSQAVLFKTSSPALQFTSGDGTYLTEVRINSPQTELNGIVLISGNNNNIGNNVINFGTLQNRPTNTYTLTINGSFTNNGIVSNNVYNLYMNISGNLANNGTWTNNITTLNGIVNQGLAMTQPFGSATFVKTVSPGRVIVTTALSFIGTAIDFNADTLEFSTGNELTMSGGYLSSCVLYKTALPAIQLTAGNGNYLSAVTIDAPQTGLYGSVLIYSNNIFKSNVINNGALQNRPVNTYTLSVTGNFTNYGSILNNVYYFYLNISGNVTNTGTWNNRETNLTGTNTHSLSFSNRFEGDFFTNTNAAGSMVATSNLIFDGCTIDLNNCSFSLANGGRLSVLNGSLTDALISGSNIHFHSIEAYCVGVIFNSDVTLQGVFQAGTGVSFNGSIINNGVMRNRGNNSYEIQVQGGLENNGSITNNVYNFTVTVLGDIHNSGTWSNYITILDGASNQYIYLINNKPIQGEIRLDANFTGSGFNWYGPSGLLAGNPAFSGATSQILRFLNPVNSGTYGQYYCRNNQPVDSRSIFINPLILPAINLTVMLEGFYIGNGLMRNSLDVNGNPEFSTSISDQITVELHEAANYSNIVFSDPEVYLNINGTAYVIMPTLGSGSYYMAIKHRNSIETVSSVPFIISGTEVVYHFDAPSDVYGNNLIPLDDGSYAIYGGDVNQDGIVDIADMTPVDNGSASFQRGYIPSDANGDGVIDTGDMTIVDNNSTQFVSSVTP